MTALPSLILKKGEARRLRAGHLWVFSNEVDTKRTPLSDFEPGDQVQILDEKGKVAGNGYVNPQSLISVRLFSRDPKYQLDQSLITHRLKVALALREQLFSAPCYRLVFGESDGLPGLIVDRFHDLLSLQITTAGMERCKEAIVAALEKVLRPSAIIINNDTASRQLEGLESYVETLGELPDFLHIEENGINFHAAVLGGQKTGWFYDHRLNRVRMADYIKGKRVLDLFSYIGGWGIQAAVRGADQVLCVDDSATAINQVVGNARLNSVEDKVSALKGDAFDTLKTLRAEREKFDVVILDPPAFIRRKKDVPKGLEAYQRINELAMRVLARDGILISASCSYHLRHGELQKILLKGSRHLDRSLLILEQGHQGPDHPVHPAIPETDYLKAFFARVLPS